MTMMDFFEKFPWSKGTVAAGIFGILLMTLVAAVRLTLGKIFPDGYEPLIYTLAAFAGIGGGIGIGKRATDYTLAAIKTGDAATVKQVTGPPKIENTEDKPPEGEKGEP